MHAFAPLMIDRYPIHDCIPFIGALLIRHHDISVVIEVGGSDEDERDNSADRHMAVIISLLVHLEELRIHNSFHKQSRDSDLVSYHFVEIIVLTERRGVERDIQLLDGFNTY